MLIGYGKIGRAMPLTNDGWGVVGGDMEPPRLLDTLARQHPEDTFVIVSMCRDDPQACGYPPNIVNLWTPELQEWYRTYMKPYQHAVSFGKGPEALEAIQATSDLIDQIYAPLVEKLDGVVMWSGQHGTSNGILPSVTNRAKNGSVTRPYASFTYYAGGLYRLINKWRERDPKQNEEVWLIADARNYLKARDIKWPLKHPVLGQFNFQRELHHERFGDRSNPADFWGHGDQEQSSRWETEHTWRSQINYVYSGLEVCSVLPRYIGHHYMHSGNRRPFGIFINEAGGHVGQGKDQIASTHQLSRATIMKEWVLPLDPAFVHGKWTAASLKELGREVTSASFEDYYPLLNSVKCTFTTPSSYSGWATTKPWEAFAAGTVCFRHPEYDTQDHIYGKLPDWVREWLSPPTPQDLWARVHALEQDRTTCEAIIHEQYQVYMLMCTDKPWITAIENRLYS